jgi:hypothetical protein
MEMPQALPGSGGVRLDENWVSAPRADSRGGPSRERAHGIGWLQKPASLPEGPQRGTSPAPKHCGSPTKRERVSICRVARAGRNTAEERCILFLSLERASHLSK